MVKMKEFGETFIMAEGEVHILVKDFSFSNRFKITGLYKLFTSFVNINEG